MRVLLVVPVAVTMIHRSCLISQPRIVVFSASTEAT